MRAAVPLLFAAACGSSSASTDSGGGATAHAWKPQHARALTIARMTTDNLSHDPSGARPDWVLYDPKGDQVVFVGGEAGYQRALAIARSYDVDAPLPPRYGGASSAPPSIMNPFDDPTPHMDGIRAVDDSHYEIDRALVDRILADPMATARGARVVPSVKNGLPNGFKLYAIRPDSVFAALGFKNGDTITAINGYDLTSPDKALEVYAQIKDSTTFDVAITRRGRDLVLHYAIK